MKTYKIRHLEARNEDARMVRFDGSQDNGQAVARLLKADGFVLVAEMRAKSLDDVFARSQNVIKSWIAGDRVHGMMAVLKRGGCRSTSIGDIIEVDGVLHMVDAAGFTVVST